MSCKNIHVKSDYSTLHILNFIICIYHKTEKGITFLLQSIIGLHIKQSSICIFF